MTEKLNPYVKGLLVIITGILTVYLILPAPVFPDPPQDVIQSDEPADTEDPDRRAYFTNYSRDEIIKHYEIQFNKNIFGKLPLISYRLNYPPEEAKNMIRDQTRSTFLEEIVHPLRESLIINGFHAEKEQDTIIVSGVTWKHKIIIRYVKSRTWMRVLFGSGGIIIISLSIYVWFNLLRKVWGNVVNKRKFQ